MATRRSRETDAFQQSLLFVLLAGSTGLFVWLSILFDLFGEGVSRPWVIYLIISVFACPSLFCLALLKSKRLNYGFAAIAILVLLSTVIPWHPKKRFVRDLFSLEPGASTQEVELRMAKYMLRVDGNAEHWAAREPVVQVDDRQLTYSYERWGGNTGHIALRDGQVVAVEFLAD